MDDVGSQVSAQTVNVPAHSRDADVRPAKREYRRVPIRKPFPKLGEILDARDRVPELVSEAVDQVHDTVLHASGRKVMDHVEDQRALVFRHRSHRVHAADRMPRAKGERSSEA